MMNGGQYFDNLKLYSTNFPISQEHANEIWRILSQRYANQASGNVYGFVKGAWPGSIFNTVEYPTLTRQGTTVTNIFTELFN